MFSHTKPRKEPNPGKNQKLFPKEETAQAFAQEDEIQELSAPSRTRI